MIVLSAKMCISFGLKGVCQYKKKVMWENNKEVEKMVYDRDSRLLLILQKRSDSWQQDRKSHRTILHIAITVTSVWHNLRIDDLLSETGFLHITTKEHFKTNSPQQLTLDVDHRSTQNNNVAQGFENFFKLITSGQFYLIFQFYNRLLKQCSRTGVGKIST